MGGLKPHQRDGGYVLLDVLAALLIAAIGFVVVLGAMSLAGSAAVRQAQRVEHMIEQRNANAKNQAVLFQKE